MAGSGFEGEQAAGGLAVEADADAVVGPFEGDVTPGVDPGDVTTAARDGTLVIEVVKAMGREPVGAGLDGAGGMVEGPGLERVAAFEHEVDVRGRPVVGEDHEPGGGGGWGSMELAGAAA
jgi:hypothetical protein